MAPQQNPHVCAQTMVGTTSGLTQISPRKPLNHSRTPPRQKTAHWAELTIKTCLHALLLAEFILRIRSDSGRFNVLF